MDYKRLRDQKAQTTADNGNAELSNGEADGFSSYLKQKIIGAVKSTKESPYVKSIYEETASVFGNEPQTAESSNEINELPTNASITLYKSYSSHVNKEYITHVKGLISCTGVMSRKNRLLLNLAQRISKSSNSTATENQLESELHDAIYNPDSKNKEPDTSSVSTSSSSIAADPMKERMEGIMARNLPNTPLKITIGSNDTGIETLLGASLYSDNFGMFAITIVTPYEPSYIAVSSLLNSNVLKTIDAEIIGARGISVITDIDDTIRETGVLGDKRDVFRNVFSKPYSECEINGVAEWFQELHSVYKCPIHYVSNSPWQIYNIIIGFMTFLDLPVSSIHLRQYSGNLIASFTQPSAERKRPSLVKIMQDFPNRKFILIGDSGEQDLEAYLSLIPQFAPQISAIYIRVVPGSLSSFGADTKKLQELEQILDQRHKIKEEIFKNPTGIDSDDSTNDSQTDKSAFNLSTASSPRKSRTVLNQLNDTGSKIKKLAPLVPRKPISLRSSKIDKNTMSFGGHNLTTNQGELLVDLPMDPSVAANGPPDLPPRPNGNAKSGDKGTTKSLLDILHSGTSTRAAETNVDRFKNKLVSDNSNTTNNDTSGREGLGLNSGYSSSQDTTDKKFTCWKEKITRVVNELPEHVEFKMWVDVEEVKNDSIRLIEHELDRE